MNVILLAKFIYMLNISPFEKKALTACLMYNRPKQEINIPLLCGCSKTLELKSKKLLNVCSE